MKWYTFLIASSTEVVLFIPDFNIILRVYALLRTIQLNIRSRYGGLIYQEKNILNMLTNVLETYFLYGTPNPTKLK